jgi:hypothetical protein
MDSQLVGPKFAPQTCRASGAQDPANGTKKSLRHVEFDDVAHRRLQALDLRLPTLTAVLS